MRVASRAANSIRGGYPVASYDELKTARTIFISVPVNELPAVLGELQEAPLQWERHSLLLADSEYDSEVLRPFSAKGANVASFSFLPELGNQRFLVEGDPKAILAAKRVLESDITRALSIASGRKSEVLGVTRFMQLIGTSLLVAANDSFRAVGLPTPDSHALIEAAASAITRTFLKSGRGALTNIDTSLVTYHLGKLQASAPENGEYYKHFLECLRARKLDLIAGE